MGRCRRKGSVSAKINRFPAHHARATHVLRAQSALRGRPDRKTARYLLGNEKRTFLRVTSSTQAPSRMPEEKGIVLDDP